MTEPKDKKAFAAGVVSAKALMSSRSKAPPPQDTAPGLILAIGDSWFNYWPRGDVLDCLEQLLGHEVERNAKPGRTLAEMLHGGPSEGTDGEAAHGMAITWLIRRIASLSDSEKPRLTAILISAGGNDVAGSPSVLLSLINDRGVDPALNEAGVKELVDGRLRELFVALLACITQACDSTLQRRPPILLHGYDYPIPDGRGVLGNPWLAPAFEKRHYDDPSHEDRKAVMRQLIDRLNEMQISLIDEVSDFAHVRHVDVRGALAADASYRLFWQNELHPTIPVGFGIVARRFMERLAKAAAAPAGYATPSTSS